MLIIIFTCILLHIGLSFTDNCPLSKHCTCSSDKTVIQCSKSRLTNDLLSKLNSQLSKSTTVLNLSSNSLTSIKSLSNLNSLEILDLSYNKIHTLPSDLFISFPQLKLLNVQNNSLTTIPKTFKNIPDGAINLLNNRFYCTCEFKLFKANNFLKQIICQNNKQFNEHDFCQTKRSFLHIYPQHSQIVYENEPFILNCSSNLQHYWTLNNKFYPSTITSFSYSTIIIHQFQANHSGIWTCHSLAFNRSISLTVLKRSSTLFCSSIQMNTSKGYFYWPRTLINTKIAKKCPFGSAAWLKNSNEYAQAWYACSSKGQWIDLDVSQCAFQTNISRIFDYLSLNQTNILLRLVKYLSEINQNYLQLHDIILLIDLIDEQKLIGLNQDRIILIYHLTDFILQLKNDFILSNEYQFALKRLKLIIEYLLDFTDLSWQFVGKELTSINIRPSLSSKLCIVPNRSLLIIVCDIDDGQVQPPAVAIQFPYYLDETDDSNAIFRLIVYRQSTLFTSNSIDNRNNPVIYIRSLLSDESSSIIKLTFYDHFDHASIGIWSSNESSWQTSSSVCEIHEQNGNYISTNCVLMNNESFSITYLGYRNAYKKRFNYADYAQFPIYISSVVASTCLMVTICVGIGFYKAYEMSRYCLHCLINYWINIAILLPLFAFGIQQNQYEILCKMISIGLQYFCLTTMTWFVLLTYDIWKQYADIFKTKNGPRKFLAIFKNRLSTVKSRSQSIVRVYLLAYGMGLFICCFIISVSPKQLQIAKICFPNDPYAIIIMGVLILICILFQTGCLLSVRNRIKILKQATKHAAKGNLRSKPNKVLPILSSLDQNDEEIISKINYQHEIMNQLLSMLFQSIILTFLYLSSLAIHIRPLSTYKLPFEQLIYSYLYGFFALVLSFFILSFHVLLRFDVLKRYYLKTSKFYQSSDIGPPSLTRDFHIKNECDLPSLEEPISTYRSSSSNNSSDQGVSEMFQSSDKTSFDNESIDGSKYVRKIQLDTYNCHCRIRKINPISASQNIQLTSFTIPPEDIISHQTKTIFMSKRRSLDNSLEIYTGPTENMILCQPQASSSKAIVRTLPIIHQPSEISQSNVSKSIDVIHSNDSSTKSNLTNADNQSSLCRNSLSSTDVQDEAYVSLNRMDYLIKRKSSSPNETSTIWKMSPYGSVPLVYIDQDEEHSVSLKSSCHDSKTSLNTILNKEDCIEEISSLSNFSNDMNKDVMQIDQINLHESSV